MREGKMRIDNINNSYLNKTGTIEGNKKGASPFGSDSVQFGSVSSNPLISRAQMSGLFKKDPKWTFDWKGDTDIIGRGIAPSSDGSAYVARRAVLKKLNSEDGSVLWEKEFNGMAISSSPAVEGKDGSVLAATGDHQLVSLNPKTGEQNWAYYTRIPAEDPKISPDGTIYTRNDHDLIALNQDGSEKFRFPIEDFSHDIKGFDKDGTAFVSSDRGIFAISNDGSEKWHVPGTEAKVFENDPEHVYTIQIKTDRKFFTTESDYSSELTSRDPETGKENWKRNFDIIKFGGVAGDRLILSDKGSVHCIDIKTGKDIWSPKEKRTVRAVMEDGVAIANDSNRLEGLDPENGNSLWKMDLEETPGPSIFPTKDGTFLTFDLHHIYEINGRSGKIKFRQRIPGEIESIVPSKDGKKVFVTDGKTKNISLIELSPNNAEIKPDNTNSESNKEIKVDNSSVNIGGVVLPRMGKKQL